MNDGSLSIRIDDLIAYTAWERGTWFAWFRRQGEAALSTATGPGDGRFSTIGDVMRHIFSAETRYVDRLAGRELTDTASIAAGNLESLFDFSQKSRKALLDFIATFPATEWDVAHDYQILTYAITATPRKIITHVLMHEIRHWAQIATVLRLNGYGVEPHDFLFSPVTLA